MWDPIKKLILEFLRKEFIKIAIVNLIKAPWMLDFRIWAIGLIAGYLFDEIAKPIVNLFFRKAGYTYSVIEGHHVLKEINSANDAGTWNGHSDNV